MSDDIADLLFINLSVNVIHVLPGEDGSNNLHCFMLFSAEHPDGLREAFEYATEVTANLNRKYKNVASVGLNFSYRPPEGELDLTRESLVVLNLVNINEQADPDIIPQFVEELNQLLGFAFNSYNMRMRGNALGLREILSEQSVLGWACFGNSVSCTMLVDEQAPLKKLALLSSTLTERFNLPKDVFLFEKEEPEDPSPFGKGGQLVRMFVGVDNTWKADKVVAFAKALSETFAPYIDDTDRKIRAEHYKATSPVIQGAYSALKDLKAIAKTDSKKR